MSCVQLITSDTVNSLNLQSGSQTKLSVSKCGNIRPQFLPWGEISPAHPVRLYHLPPFSLFVFEILLFLSPLGFFFCTSVSATVSISVHHTTPHSSYFISLLHRKHLHLARLPLSSPPCYENPSGFFHTQHISFWYTPVFILISKLGWRVLVFRLCVSACNLCMCVFVGFAGPVEWILCEMCETDLVLFGVVRIHSQAPISEGLRTNSPLISLLFFFFLTYFCLISTVH